MAMPNQRMLPFEGHIAEIILAADYVSPRLANTGNRFFQSDQYVSTTFAVLGLGESSQNVTDTVHKRQSKKLVEFSEEQLKPAYQRWLRDGTPITFVMKLPKKQVNGCTVFRSMWAEAVSFFLDHLAQPGNLHVLKLSVLEMAKHLSQLEFDVQGVRCKMYISTVYVYLPSWKQDLVARGVPVPPDSGIHFLDFVGKNPRSDSIVDRWDDKSYQDGLPAAQRLAVTAVLDGTQIIPAAVGSAVFLASGFIFTRTHAFMMCRMLQAVMSAINAGTPFASMSDLMKLVPDSFDPSGETGKGGGRTNANGGVRDTTNKKLWKLWKKAMDKDHVPIADDLPPSSNSVTGDAVYRLFSDLDLVDPVNILLHVKGLAPDYVQTLSDEEKDTFCSALQKDVRDWRMRVRAEGCCRPGCLHHSSPFLAQDGVPSPWPEDNGAMVCYGHYQEAALAMITLPNYQYGKVIIGYGEEEEKRTATLEHLARAFARCQGPFCGNHHLAMYRASSTHLNGGKYFVLCPACTRQVEKQTNAQVERIKQEANEQGVEVADLPALRRVILAADEASTMTKVPCGDTHRRNFGCRLTVGKHDDGGMLVVKNQDGEPICAPCASCIRGVIRNPPQYYALLPEERTRIASALVKSLEGVPREDKAVLDQLYKNVWQLHKDHPVLLPVQIALLRRTRTGGALFSAQFRQMLDALRGPTDFDDDDDEE